LTASSQCVNWLDLMSRVSHLANVSDQSGLARRMVEQVNFFAVSSVITDSTISSCHLHIAVLPSAGDVIGAVSMPPIGITVLIAALASKDEDQRPSCGRARAVTVLATVPRVDI